MQGKRLATGTESPEYKQAPIPIQGTRSPRTEIAFYASRWSGT
ncbi:MAG: hypothetical protein AVDCRST_MAG56-673 [uncultured Cytophagales bacterium]|uniref:Uncharacterized protein n=1 Tax=uncultured Cytophagales bacterium TaxID=158755 RepID=A0A6J4HC70_9SPHI|nr:MAG: hypothetical protein AVDCRST_MAG56-673 [uncultured Cytophagales bacterium]